MTIKPKLAAILLACLMLGSSMSVAAASTKVIVFEKRFTIFLLGLSNANLLKTIP